MSVQVANNRFIDFSLRAGFYQQIFGKVSSLQESGQQLVRAIETAHTYREMDNVEELGRILSNHPIKEYRLIGQYYLGWCAYRKGIDVQTVFEEILETSQTYKTKALWSLAAIESSKGNYEAELKHFVESQKYAIDLPARIDLARGIAVVKAKEGYHAQALKDLENLIPILRFANPHTYYDCLNSLAVELCGGGRVEEARNVCRITLASPFAFAYPEWRETEQDLALRGYKSRSSIRVKQIPGNIAYLPEPSPVSDTSTQSEAARVLSIEEWKKKMGKEPNGDDLPPDASEKDLYLKIMELIAQKDLSTSELWQVIAFVEKLSAKPSKN